MVRGTSIDCYHNLIKGKKENTQFKKIFNCVSELKEATRGEIADRLKMEKSTVSARVNKMLQLGILQEAGRRKGILQEAGRRKDKVSGINNYVVSVNKDGQGRLF